ncbi:MAG: TRAM domain-containing protein [Candidatus Saccharimonadales bacterium]
MKRTDEVYEVTITKLIHGGQGLAELPDGRKVFVWNALPGEKVKARIIKQKRSYAEAIADEVITPSSERIAPKEDNYLATSPWQMMTYEAENRYKTEIVKELFTREKVILPEFAEAIHTDNEWHYRNKMEYSFWGDDDGLHLALHLRGSHGKQIVTGSQLALPAIDTAANAVCELLSELQTRAGDLKTIIVRTSQNGDVVAALYTKLTKFTKLELPKELKGLRVYHSNPKSPASVPTKLLQELGDVTLADELLGKSFVYDVDSFFQVNIPIFEKALERIKNACADEEITDMYAGVGSIGLSVAKKSVELIELDPATVAMARENFVKSNLQGEVIEASTEKALEHITGKNTIIFDPPRAGLHAKVVGRVLETLPPQVIYLSCNPATHARDLALLQGAYEITQFKVFNFFPRTPHIETLAVLKRKN